MRYRQRRFATSARYGKWPKNRHRVFLAAPPSVTLRRSAEHFALLLRGSLREGFLRRPGRGQPNLLPRFVPAGEGGLNGEQCSRPAPMATTEGLARIQVMATAHSMATAHGMAKAQRRKPWTMCRCWQQRRARHKRRVRGQRRQDMAPAQSMATAQSMANRQTAAKGQKAVDGASTQPAQGR